MFYRFKCGTFIKADNFEEAKLVFTQQILDEKEDDTQWSKCTCLGMSHRSDCPEMAGVITY